MEKMLLNEVSMGIQNGEEVLDLSKAETFKPDSEIKRRSTGSLSIVSRGNCNRISLSQELIQAMGYPWFVQVSFLDDKVLICKADENDMDALALKGDTPRIIYNVALVRRITNLWGLDFKTKSSITLGTHKISVINGKVYAVVSI
jgi:hypothetical protein